MRGAASGMPGISVVDARPGDEGKIILQTIYFLRRICYAGG
jgi:hypothetical protein